MIRSYRLRRLLLRSLGLRRALGVFVVAQIALFIGFGLCYELIIIPILRWESQWAHTGVVRFLPNADIDVAVHYIGGFMLVAGGFLTFVSIRSAVNVVLRTVNPNLTSGTIDVYLKRSQLANGPRIAALGGGTGLSTLLRGLKGHSANLTAIVTVTDDGGSSGRLVQDKGMIPPGDIRNCLVALADAEKAMTDVFQHRFRNDSGALSGHSLGNLFIAAMVDQAGGDFERAVELASDVLAIRGRVLPASLDTVHLHAVFDDGSEATGETNIASTGKRIRRLTLEPATCTAHRSAIEAIKQADVVCIGPGSVYTSVIPNLLVPGIAEALRESKAIKIYICNVMTQPGESDAFTASQHVRSIVDQVPTRVFDYVMVNTGTPTPAQVERYEGAGQMMVEPDIDVIRGMGFRVLVGNYMSDSDLIRHDPMKVAQRIMTFLERL